LIITIYGHRHGTSVLGQRERESETHTQAHRVGAREFRPARERERERGREGEREGGREGERDRGREGEERE